MSIARHALPLLAFAFLFTFSLPAFAQDPPTPPAEELDVTAAFQGKFVYAGGQKQKDKLVEAIEAATEDMNFVTRPIARSRLKDTNTVFGSITIALTGDNISIQRDKQTPIVTPASGAAGKWTSPDDETYTVTQKLTDRKITQNFQAGDGKKTAVYTLSKDGKSLTLTVTVSSPKLPQKVVYSLSYRKS